MLIRKIQKIRKNKIYKKKKLRNQVLKPNNILPINTGFQHTQKERGRKIQKKKP